MQISGSENHSQTSAAVWCSPAPTPQHGIVILTSSPRSRGNASLQHRRLPDLTLQTYKLEARAYDGLGFTFKRWLVCFYSGNDEEYIEAIQKPFSNLVILCDSVPLVLLAPQFKQPWTLHPREQPLRVTWPGHQRSVLKASSILTAVWHSLTDCATN